MAHLLGSWFVDELDRVDAAADGHGNYILRIGGLSVHIGEVQWLRLLGAVVAASNAADRAEPPLEENELRALSGDR